MNDSLTKPVISWDNGIPISTRFGDIYFQKENGLEETRHVFLKGINAPYAWQGKKNFVIGETGFGTGLNFLATWDLWHRTASYDSKLYYLAVEGFPLEKEQMERALEPFSCLAPYAKSLLELYPPRHPGFHQLVMPGNKIVLTLLLGQAEAMLKKVSAQMDGWYLDGFSPRLNPDMWRVPVLAEVARLSKKGASLATFTTAGAIRKTLTQSGFTVWKASGFGAKKDCLRAIFTKDTSFDPHNRETGSFSVGSSGVPVKTVAIVGGGIAGASLGYALTKAGIEVTVIEQHPTPAPEASGNPAGMLHPRLTLGNDVKGKFHVQGYFHTLRMLDGLTKTAAYPLQGLRGMIDLAFEAARNRRYRTLIEKNALTDHIAFLNRQEASDAAGIELPCAGLYFPYAGVIYPVNICKTLLDGIPFIAGRKVSNILRKQGKWQLLDLAQKVILTADAVVLANAYESGILLSRSLGIHLPLGLNRGQITYIGVTKDTRKQKSSLGFGGYLSPPVDCGHGQKNHILGATFERIDPLETLKCKTKTIFDSHSSMHTNHQKNIETLDMHLPGIARGPVNGGRCAYRATTRDYLPLVGSIFSQPFDKENERSMKQDFFPSDNLNPSHQTTLYVMSGFGSHGFLAAPLAAEILTAQMLSLPLPAERDMAQKLHPLRFAVSSLETSVSSSFSV